MKITKELQTAITTAFKWLQTTRVKIRNKAILLNNKRRWVVRIESKGKKFPYLIVSERYEKQVRWSLRILTLIGIVTSILTLKWYFALGLSVLLCVIERLLEAIAFQFTSMYIQPILDEWDGEKWLGMGFYKIGNAQHVGLLIKTKEQAEKLYECIKAWNFGEYIDQDNNIRLSFVIEKDNRYTTFLYPSFERQTVKKFREEVDYEMFKKKEMKEHMQRIVFITFCKQFPYASNSGFGEFASAYRPGQPFALGVYCPNVPFPDTADGQQVFIKSSNLAPIGARPIVKHHVKIKRVDDLLKTEYEYTYRRLMMGK